MKSQDILLKELKKNTHHHVSGEMIAKKCGVTRAAIWKDVQSLREMGYDIDSHPHEGYRLQGVPDKLFADEVLDGLGTKYVGRQVFSYESLDSTNTAAWRLGEEGYPEGTAVLAEHQKKGRGRLGREWVSPKGKNLLFSILIRPTAPPSDISKITLLLALSSVRAVKRSYGVLLGVKWPNDLVYHDKKVGGILTEMNAEADRIHFVVAGLGLNVNASKEELPEIGTSLLQISGIKRSRVTLLQAIFEELENDLDRFKSGGFEKLSEEWESYSQTTGRRISVTLQGRTVQGEARGIDKEGALWVRTDSGLLERIVSGDVLHLRRSIR